MELKFLAGVCFTYISREQCVNNDENNEVCFPTSVGSDLCSWLEAFFYKVSRSGFSSRNCSYARSDLGRGAAVVRVRYRGHPRLLIRKRHFQKSFDPDLRLRKQCCGTGTGTVGTVTF